MALTTQSMNGEIKRDGEAAGAPEGYEFVRDEDGRMSIKKIRKSVKIKEEKVEEEKPIIKTKRAKKFFK